MSLVFGLLIRVDLSFFLSLSQRSDPCLSSFLNSSNLPTMFFIPGVVFTTEHIHKFIKGGLDLEVPCPGVFAPHGSFIECVISSFRHTKVCDFRLYANLFLSNLRESCNTPILPRLLTRVRPFKPRLDFARVNPSKFLDSSSLQC
jgi:hypothetical protein